MKGKQKDIFSGFDEGDPRFTTDKRIREAVAGDITITKIERQIIDTREFQRLRGIKQLGTAYLIYPSAIHTRFEHSLGTLEMAQQIIERINANPQPEVKVDKNIELFIRLVALLHDIGHLPFNHTLTEEMRILSAHDTTERLNHFLSDSSITPILGKELAEEITRVLSAKEEKQISELPYPYVADIVSNTICADLLDYLNRDVYFTGLKQAYDLRFMNFFMISKEGSYKNRLILRLEKRNEVRRDVLSEILRLLDLRYSLAERVYYHHAKIITSAMIGKAVQIAGLTEQDLYDLRDEELLSKLEKENGGAAHIIRCLRERKIFKPVYRVGYERTTAARNQTRFVNNYHWNAKARLEKEKEIAGYCGIPEENVIIYCPNSEMAVKEADVKVRWLDRSIKPLKEIPELEDLTHPVKEKHKRLWKAYVFLDQDSFRSKAQEVADACYYYVFGEQPNEIEEFRHVGPEQPRKTLEQLALEEQILFSEMKELERVAQRSNTVNLPKTVDEWRILLSEQRVEKARKKLPGME